MLNLLLNYVLRGRHLEFMLKNMFTVRNGTPMPELGKIDLWSVEIAQRMINSCSAGTDGGHFGKKTLIFEIYSQNREGHSSFFSSFTDFPLIKLPPETDLFFKKNPLR